AENPLVVFRVDAQPVVADEELDALSDRLRADADDGRDAGPAAVLYGIDQQVLEDFDDPPAVGDDRRQILLNLQFYALRLQAARQILGDLAEQGRYVDFFEFVAHPPHPAELQQVFDQRAHAVRGAFDAGDTVFDVFRPPGGNIFFQQAEKAHRGHQRRF